MNTETTEEKFDQLAQMWADGCYDFTPSTPAPNAVLNDWRFLPYAMEIHQSGEKTHSSWNVDDVKGKGKKAKFDQISFALCIPGLISEKEAAQ